MGAIYGGMSEGEGEVEEGKGDKARCREREP